MQKNMHLTSDRNPLDLAAAIPDDVQKLSQSPAFLNRISSLIGGLATAIRSTDGFEQWNADYSIRSFDEIGRWLRCVTSNTASSNTTLFEVSAYFAHALVNANPNLEWIREVSARSYDYQCAVLVGFAPKNSMNPVRIVQTAVRTILKGTKPTTALSHFYVIWLNQPSNIFAGKDDRRRKTQGTTTKVGKGK